MPSPGKGLLVLLLFFLCASSGTLCAAEEPAPRATADTPGAAEIEKALEKVKADPNLSAHQTIRRLQWKEDPKRRSGEWRAWIADLFGWIASSARFLVWALAIVLVAWLAVYLTRILRTRGLRGGSGRFVAPTHVQDLDIRPESLPADIGAAARRLWDSGEQRAALALLYRGLLSRLAHVHHVPIKDSSTEGDCLALAARHLAETHRREYVARLVRLWQRAVYGGEDAETASVHALCDEFAAALDAPDAPGDLATVGQAS